MANEAGNKEATANRGKGGAGKAGGTGKPKGAGGKKGAAGKTGETAGKK